MPRTSSRRKAFEAAQLPLDLSGSCDLWLDDLAPAASVWLACSVTAPAGPVVGASLPRCKRLFAGRFNGMLGLPLGTWRRHAGGDFASPCYGTLTGRGLLERRA
jgi:hypothetical protein